MPQTPPPTTNSNVQSTSEPPFPAPSAQAVSGEGINRGIAKETLTGLRYEPVEPPTAAPKVATRMAARAEDEINAPMTVSVEQFKQAYELLHEQVEDIVEPPSARTAAFKLILAMMKDAIKKVETTGKVQVIAITATGIVPQQMTRLEQIRADTEKANVRLRQQAEEDAKNPKSE